MRRSIRNAIHAFLKKYDVSNQDAQRVLRHLDPGLNGCLLRRPCIYSPQRIARILQDVTGKSVRHIAFFSVNAPIPLPLPDWIKKSRHTKRWTKNLSSWILRKGFPVKRVWKRWSPSQILNPKAEYYIVWLALRENAPDPYDKRYSWIWPSLEVVCQERPKKRKRVRLPPLAALERLVYTSVMDSLEGPVLSIGVGEPQWKDWLCEILYLYLLLDLGGYQKRANSVARLIRMLSQVLPLYPKRGDPSTWIVAVD